MDQEKQREIARKGGANVPHDKRSFAQDRELAAAAGRKGGRSVAPQRRSFAQNRALAAAAGRKGGQASQSRRMNAHRTDDAGQDHQEEPDAAQSTGETEEHGDHNWR
jgi:general stress protein YciG